MDVIVKKVMFPFTKFKNKWKNTTKKAQNDDFFKAVSKCLEQLETLKMFPTAKTLRNKCYVYAVENEWVKQEVIKNANLDPLCANDVTLWEDYLTDLKNSDGLRWKFDVKIEGQIICNLFNLEMHVLKIKNTTQQIDWLNGQIDRINRDSTKKNIIHVRNHENGKFEAEIRFHCCWLREAKSQLNLRLDEFVTCFVKEFEAKLASYVIISENAIAKTGKFSELYSKKISEITNGVFEYSLGWRAVTNKPGSTASDACYVTNLSQLMHYFVKNRSDFRKALVEVGVDIFQSFEMQFGRVTSDLGEKWAMYALARDATSRAMQRIRQGPSDVIIDLHSVILEGVKFGNSRTEAPSSGYTIKYEFRGISREWNTSQMYEKSGLLMFDDLDNIYYKQKMLEDSPLEFGYRRSFIYDNWGDLRTNFISKSEKMEKFFEYFYIFKPEEMKQKSDDLNLKLECCGGEFLPENRLMEIIVESKDEVLDELNSLKTISDKIGGDAKTLNNIELILKTLKIDNYIWEFQSRIENEMKSDENIPAFIKICEKMDEIGVQQNDKNERKFSESIWFNMKTPLNSFTRLISIGNEIESELNRGSAVVIHGPSGVGKSELAAKFAHFKYKEVDNAIWIDCDSWETILESCKHLAQTLNLGNVDDKLSMRNVSELIDEIYSIIFNRKCLLILDNAENYESVKWFLNLFPKYKSHKPHLIITSRQDFAWNNNFVHVKSIALINFSQSQTVKFVKLALSLKNNEREDDVIKLYNILHGFPFTMQIAVNYIRNVMEKLKLQNIDFTINEYLLMYESNYKYLSENNSYFDRDQIKSSIFTVLAIKLNDLQSQDYGEKAFYLLKMLSYFPSKNIPKIIFFNGKNNSEEFILGLLEFYSLVNNEGHFVRVHSLISRAIKETVTEAEEKTILGNVLKLIIKQIRNENSDNYNREIASVLNFARKHEELIENFVNSYINTDIFPYFLKAIVSQNQFEIFWQLIYQIGLNHENVLASLLNFEYEFGERLIHSAVKNPLMTRLLIEKKAIVCVIDKNHSTPLHNAAIHGEIEAAKSLIENGHPIDPIDKNRFTPLHYAIENNQVEVIRLLLENGANANIKNNLSVLHLAISQNNVEAIDILLEFDSVNINAGHEMTPLRMAITHAQTHVVKTLLNKGCECNTKFVYDFTALIFAVIKSEAEIVEALLAREEVDVNARMLDGNTALHVAVYMENLEILRLLLTDERLDKNIVNNEGKTAFDIASQNVQNYIKQCNN